MPPVTRDLRAWRTLAGCTGTMLCIGTAYSWSLFSRPLMASFGWTGVEVSLAFALMTFGIGIGAFAGGFFHDRFGARPVAVAGSFLWGFGTLLAGLGTARFGLLWLYATYGIVGGVGAGMAYLAPGAALARWFPHHRGLASGVTLFAFGAGSLVYNAVVARLPSFARAANAANTIIVARNHEVQTRLALPATPQAASADVHAVMAVLAWSGVVLIGVGVLASLAIAAPPTPATTAASSSVASSAAGRTQPHDYTPHEMLRTRGFYAIWAIVFVDCFAGLALLGNAVPIYSKLTDASAATAALVYGWLSIFNGIGRLLWAWLSDAIGRARSFSIAFVVEATGIAALGLTHEPLGVGVAFAVVLLSFGGVLAIAPATMADYYGTRFMGEDYGYVITAVSVAGLTGPVLFGLLEDVTGSMTSAIMPLAALVALAAILPLFARKPSTLPARIRESLLRA